MLVLVDENAVAAVPRSLLKRQRDQVAKAALGKRVLIGEETVVRIEADARPAFHRFGEKVRAEFPREGRRNCLVEK